MSSTDEILIRERAYRIWEKEGFPHGKSEAHWHQAIQELEAEAAQPAKAKPAKAKADKTAAVTTKKTKAKAAPAEDKVVETTPTAKPARAKKPAKSA